MAVFETGDIETDIDVTTTIISGYKVTSDAATSASVTTSVNTKDFSDSIRITVSTSQAISVSASTSTAQTETS